MNDRQVKVGHRLQSCLKTGEQIRLMQKLSAVVGEMLFHHGGQYFRAPQPPAQTNELRQLFIVHFVHCLLHAVLSAIQFLPHICPIALVCRIDDRLGVWRD
jgi:hypothetical protein